ncbi:hypothetical protein PLESTB_001183000 [Pleodorina starrii]|uniref:Methyltransferase FkbM domain-containing protein n=1 Tax=Pleodorina starrii TaxID=330485 RepID=A0A9W6BT92_9CHLO|nr:hypothetical protein PLESTM_000259000 [Pleodorina starrii]GLC57096.1 hypothetical protein PLESTB_001183000 [Pleodorina starrii]GLC64931.1 hypothetical protein PLESTF_000223300 [Pleodorina starrii]
MARWTSGDAPPVERKRSRRIAICASSWAPWFLPFIALAMLLAIRSSIVSIIERNEMTAARGAAAAAAAGAGSTADAAAAGAARARQYQVRTHCSNSCFKAFDGVCDEGRPVSGNTTLPAAAAVGGGGGGGPDGGRRRGRGLLAAEGNVNVSELLCDLGTDCSDCGPWVGTVPDGWAPSAGPVSWLRATHNASMFVRLTSTPRPFRAAITHHKTDPDVSAMLWHYGAMEGGVTRVLHHILDGQCEPGSGGAGGAAAADAAGSGRRRLVLDVGANFGYYTVQAALYGCSVVAFEPVRKFRAFLEWSIHAAGVAERVYLVDMALSDGEGPLPLVLPRDGSYWGLASISGANVMAKEALETLTVNATTLDRWEVWAPPGAKPSDVLLLKMDVEGWEAPVLRGGSKLLSHNVENVLLEYSPGIFERNNMSDLAPQAALPAALLALSRSNFSLAHLPTFEFAAPWPPRPIDPAEPLPPLEEVTPAALDHDIKAFEYRHAMEVDPGGCGLPEELKSAFPVWRHCREWTYGVHPKGFRSSFGFNTNLWATRGSAAAARHMRLSGAATLFDEAQDVRVWTSQRRPGTALGLINCTNIGSGHLQLFRCPCPPTAPPECAREQQLVTRLAAEGKMPFTGIGQ